MKKLLIFNLVLALIFAVFACDTVYDDIYDELDKANDYTDSLDLIYSKKVLALETYTLEDADYATIGTEALKVATNATDSSNANSIKNYKNFSASIMAKDYIPFLLNKKYFSYTGGTEMKINYKYYRDRHDYVKNFKTSQYVDYELVDADYDMLGEASGEPGYSNYFKSSISPDTWLPRFLDSTYTSPTSWDFRKLTFRYNSGGVTYDRYYVYYYQEGWKKLSDPYVLTAEDYDAMGPGYGDVGQYDNFSSSLPPENYLPNYLKTKFLAAQAGDVRIVFYKYFSSTVQTRVKEYVYDGTIWAEYQTTVNQDAIFKFTLDGWLFVPPLKFIETTLPNTREYTLTDADFALVGNGRYFNFDVRTGAAEESIDVRIAKISTILKANFNDIAVGDVFLVHYKAYNGANVVLDITLEVVLDE